MMREVSGTIQGHETLIGLFPRLPANTLQRFRDNGRFLEFADGERILSEADVDYPFDVIAEGRVRVTKCIEGLEQALAVHDPGEFVGEISILTGDPCAISAYAMGEVKLIRIENRLFRSLVLQDEPAGKMILRALSRRMEEIGAAILQRERTAALGRLSAGLAHELNNPSGAALRAIDELQVLFETAQIRAMRTHTGFSNSQRNSLISRFESLFGVDRSDEPQDVIARTEREEVLESWLESKGVADAWWHAPVLLAAGLDSNKLAELAAEFPGGSFNEAIVWLTDGLKAFELSEDIRFGLSRIAGVVDAMRDYTSMDQVGLREIDIHQSLDSTLRVLGSQARHEVEIVRHYDPHLPKVVAYATELNQVWTNLISNAFDAMEGKGRLTIRTYRNEDNVAIEIADSGPGIPPALQSRIFEPFFTTKDFGRGRGLGLNITYRIITVHHRGSLGVESRPGNTRFRVTLPLSARPA